MAVRILVGDAIERLRGMPDESVHCVVTSPPYFGLRDYGTARWDGGDASCAHSVGDQVQDSKAPGAIISGVRPGVDASRCRKCGAIRIDRQIGLEPSPAEYVETLVAVFREARRVLRKDGTLWLNLGDSYAGSWGAQSRRITDSDEPSWHSSQIKNHPKRASNTGTIRIAGVKPKDLYGIPWMVAFALRADGWWLRQDIIWAKPNPMPESVTDRCTKAHEYLFLLSRSERYYFDAAAIAEVAIADNREFFRGNDKYTNGNSFVNSSAKPADGLGHVANETGKRNKRSVWTVTTQPYAEAHFATFPPALVEPCILAGAPRGGTVLDPFGGAGTTALVADRLGRDAILIELNPAYAEMARSRVIDDAGMFAEVA